MDDLNSLTQRLTALLGGTCSQFNHFGSPWQQRALPPGIEIGPEVVVGPSRSPFVKRQMY